MAHVRRCEQRQLPNVVAVDFYERGASGSRPTVVEAVDDLNGF